MAAQGRATAEALRWLAADRDVVVRGDRGSGKSTALDGLRTALSDRRLPGLLIQAGAGVSLSALLDHPSAPAHAQSEPELLAWLADELSAPRSVLLVDDLDRLDPGSARVVLRVLASADCRLIATSTRDLVRSGPAAARELVAVRAPAEVRVRPLDLAGMAELAAEELAGPVDARLVITLHSQAQGNPGVARALLAAGRVTGLLWPETARACAERFERAPADAVAAMLLGRLEASAVDALEVLALAGPVDRGALAQLVDPVLIDELADQGRIAVQAAGGDEPVLAVTPPALARTLRARAPATRHHRVSGAVRQVLDRRPQRAGPVAGPSPGPGGARVAEVVLAGAVARESAAHADWSATPGLRTANAYLAELMARPATERIAEVIRCAPRRPDDTVDDAATALYYRARWAAWRGCDPEAAVAGGPVDPRDEGLDAWLDLDGRAQGLVAAIRDGARPEAVAVTGLDASPPGVLRGGPEVLTAAALLEAGRPDLALDVSRRGRRTEGLTPNTRHYLTALGALSLVQLGEPEPAERVARAALDAAYRDQDLVGSRVHGTVWAECLVAAGETAAAWWALDAVLRLGPSGPVETTFHRRALTMACVLQARAGRIDLAQSLLHELDCTPRAHRPLIQSLHALAAVAVALATGDRVRAADLAWRAGRRYAEAGLRQPALLTWALAPLPAVAERAAVLRDTRTGTVLPLLDPYLDLQTAIAESDRAAGAVAVARVDPRLAVTLTRTARGVLGLVESGEETIERRRNEPLSDREREVAALGRDGLTNREIAARLHLSVRTVENHMSQVLRKLGARTRADLRGWTAY